MLGLKLIHVSKGYTHVVTIVTSPLFRHNVVTCGTPLSMSDFYQLTNVVMLVLKEHRPDEATFAGRMTSAKTQWLEKQWINKWSFMVMRAATHEGHRAILYYCVDVKDKRTWIVVLKTRYTISTESYSHGGWLFLCVCFVCYTSFYQYLSGLLYKIEWKYVIKLHILTLTQIATLSVTNCDTRHKLRHFQSQIATPSQIATIKNCYVTGIITFL